MLREGQGKAKAKSSRGQGKVKVKSRQHNHNLNCKYNLMGFDTIEINLVFLSFWLPPKWPTGSGNGAPLGVSAALVSDETDHLEVRIKTLSFIGLNRRVNVFR